MKKYSLVYWHSFTNATVIESKLIKFGSKNSVTAPQGKKFYRVTIIKESDYKGNLEKIKVDEHGEIIKNKDQEEAKAKKLANSKCDADLKIIEGKTIFEDKVLTNQNERPKLDLMKKTKLKVKSVKAVNSKISIIKEQPNHDKNIKTIKSHNNLEKE
ncbi:hypothetical protein KQX54_000085, partial [Cotesia glomerata]